MYRSIVVGTDGSETALAAVDQAAHLAGLCGGELTLVTAYRPVSTLAALAISGGAVGMVVPPTETDDSQLAEAELVLTQARERITGTDRVATRAQAGEPAEVILSVADELDADLVVVGSRGLRGVGRFLLGSVPNRVVHHAKRTVLIVHTD